MDVGAVNENYLVVRVENIVSLTEGEAEEPRVRDWLEGREDRKLTKLEFGFVRNL